MALVTLIGEKLAIEGEEFIYLGPNSECKNCRLKTVCFNLKPGRKYKIEKLREKQHDCNVHEGKVVVVEVSEMPISTAIDKNLPQGTTTKVEKNDCGNIGCNNYEICTNIALQKNKTYKIKKVYGKINCPKGYNLYKVDLED
ncbi:hypothetical protein GF374_03110 [Candidatus Woesearchaeota archaeon]|nr:hypothetical protein [Candidatus Woesearchaeota archaeon]